MYLYLEDFIEKNVNLKTETKKKNKEKNSLIVKIIFWKNGHTEQRNNEEK